MPLVNFVDRLFSCGFFEKNMYLGGFD